MESAQADPAARGNGGACAVECDQAIFTSVRTPMGEGYRIIAASKGLGVDEKQCITRHSPSHDALSVRSPAAKAMAFYGLPTGRLCVALSLHAGAEHTGRGGQRVYTHAVVIDRAVFEKFGYSPFQVLRAMEVAGAAAPKLKPPPILAHIRLEVASSSRYGDVSKSHEGVSLPWRTFILDQLLSRQRLLVVHPEGGFALAEHVLGGVPGSARVDVSFGVGLRFSAGRCFTLGVLSEDERLLEGRIAGQDVRLISPHSEEAPATPASEWIAFVRRHWEQDASVLLSDRTSRDYQDHSRRRLDRVGGLFTRLDDTPSSDMDGVLARVSEHLRGSPDAIEAEIIADLLRGAQRRFCELLSNANEARTERHWSPVLGVWRESAEATSFMQPVVETYLRTLSAADPVLAAKFALLAWPKMPEQASKEGLPERIDAVLENFSSWCSDASPEQLAEAKPLSEQWANVKPGCSIVDRIQGCFDKLDSCPTED